MRKIVVNKSELESAYYNMPAAVAAAHFGVCLQTFYDMLDEAKIERKRKNIKRRENVHFEVVE